MRLQTVVADAVTTGRSTEEVERLILKTRDATMLGLALILALGVIALSGGPVSAQYNPCPPSYSGWNGSCYPSNGTGYNNPYNSYSNCQSYYYQSYGCGYPGYYSNNPYGYCRYGYYHMSGCYYPGFNPYYRPYNPYSYCQSGYYNPWNNCYYSGYNNGYGYPYNPYGNCMNGYYYGSCYNSGNYYGNPYYQWHR